MTKNEKASQLAKLIEMRPPEWLTKEIYSEYQEYREQHKGSFSMRLALNELFKDVPDEDFIYDQAWKSYQVHASPKILVDKYLHGEFISDPSSGQDPKILTPENLKLLPLTFSIDISFDTAIVLNKSAWFLLTADVIELDNSLATPSITLLWLISLLFSAKSFILFESEFIVVLPMSNACSIILGLIVLWVIWCNWSTKSILKA